MSSQIKFQAERITIPANTPAGQYQYILKNIDNNYQSCTGIALVPVFVTDLFRVSLQDEKDTFIQKIPFFIFAPSTSTDVTRRVLPINIRGKGNTISVNVFIPVQIGANDQVLEVVFRLEKIPFLPEAKRTKYQTLSLLVPNGSTVKLYEKSDKLDLGYKYCEGVAFTEFQNTNSDLYKLQMRDMSDTRIQKCASVFLLNSASNAIDDRLWKTPMNGNGNIVYGGIEPDATLTGDVEVDFIFKLVNSLK